VPETLTHTVLFVIEMEYFAVFKIPYFRDVSFDLPK